MAQNNLKNESAFSVETLHRTIQNSLEEYLNGFVLCVSNQISMIVESSKHNVPLYLVRKKAKRAIEANRKKLAEQFKQKLLDLKNWYDSFTQSLNQEQIDGLDLDSYVDKVKEILFKIDSFCCKIESKIDPKNQQIQQKSKDKKSDFYTDTEILKNLSKYLLFLITSLTFLFNEVIFYFLKDSFIQEINRSKSKTNLTRFLTVKSNSNKITEQAPLVSSFHSFTTPSTSSSLSNIVEQQNFASENSIQNYFNGFLDTPEIVPQTSDTSLNLNQNSNKTNEDDDCLVIEDDDDDLSNNKKPETKFEIIMKKIQESKRENDSDCDENSDFMFVDKKVLALRDPKKLEWEIGKN
jgi:hypothetical protein